MKNIAICGSTCVGKTTLIARLRREFFPDALIVEENVEDNPYIRAAGSMQSRNVFHSQLFFYSGYLESVAGLLADKGNRERIVLFDRFIEEHALISSYRHKIGELQDAELDVCRSLAGSISSLPLAIDKVIYLHCSEQTMLNRLNIRDNCWDRNHRIENLRLLSDMYERWYDEVSARYRSMRINTDTPIDIDAVVDFILSD